MVKKTEKEDPIHEDQKRSDVALPGTIKTILEKSSIPATEKKAIAIQIASYFQGPLPPPDILKQYGSIVTDGAERIFMRYEMQSHHRVRMEEYMLTEEFRQSSRGQLFGFILSIFGLSLACMLACLGHETIAGIIGGSTIVSLAAVFVVGKMLQKRE